MSEGQDAAAAQDPPAATPVPAPVAGPAAAPAAEAPRRLASLDVLRGLAILLMVLDHCRDFFGPTGYAPTDLDRASLSVFLTRWITHPGAPVFVFLAGTSVALALRRGMDRRAMAVFLVRRALWLIVLEYTWVSAAWTFDVSGTIFFAQILWVMGLSMLVLAWLVLCPVWVSVVLGLALVGGHDLFDGLRPAEMAFPRLWKLLHVGSSMVMLGDSVRVLVIYPFLPWAGVMALGYAFGGVVDLEPRRRHRWCLGLGAACLAGFVLLRWGNVYGDPSPWVSTPDDPLRSVLSFLNVTKYPASLQFLLMSLGLPLLVLPLLDRELGFVGRVLRTFGSVPLFLYLVHLPVIHGAAALWSLARYGEAGWWFGGGARPDDYYQGQGPVFLATLAALALFYPLCRWYAGVKRRRRDLRFLRYL